MIDIKVLRENPQAVEKAAKDKGVQINVKHILELDKKVQDLQSSVQKLREDRNKFAKEKNIEKGKELKDKLVKEENALNAVQNELISELSKIPNLPSQDVHSGKDESENKEIKKWGDIPKIKSAKNHLELGEMLDIIDVERAAKVSGTRFAYLKNQAVLLEFALVQLALETFTKEGFVPVVPPVLVKREMIDKQGYLSLGEDEMFKTKDEDLFLVGTAEHAIVPMHMDEVLNKKDLPKRYVGFSTSFRREAGSYGKDTKGILRVHQFDKVEMISFTTEENGDSEHEYLLSLQEKLFQALEIPYRVVKMCTGDLGFPAARKYDLEAWIPSEGKYREVTSVSTTTDFQSRRLNIKYQDGNEKKFVHILNGTAFAIGRTIIAILENYQNEDGSIEIPKVLQKYLPFKKISKSS
jgi:seryl-tRNA synthetase